MLSLPRECPVAVVFGYRGDSLPKMLRFGHTTEAPTRSTGRGLCSGWSLLLLGVFRTRANIPVQPDRRTEHVERFMPVTHVAASVNFVEGVALLGLATLLGVTLAMLIEGMNRRLR
jgi:hypothetical protein